MQCGGGRFVCYLVFFLSPAEHLELANDSIVCVACVLSKTKTIWENINSNPGDVFPKARVCGPARAASPPEPKMLGFCLF